MKNFIFISPNFPFTYWHFCAALKKNGFRVLGIADCPYASLCWELRECLDDYYQCPDMENFDSEIAAVRYFEQKYGHIDYLESNNEYWLARDAQLREIFNITTGVRGKEIDTFQYKSKMKEKYKLAGCKTAKYILVDRYEDLVKFAEEVGYPIFAKPDIGVGAAGDYKIKNIEDLNRFYAEKPTYVTYICEQYVTGNIVSFDGVCDSNSNVIFCDSECFPPSIADVVKHNLDIFYYCLPEVPKDIDELGRRVIKAFEVKNRFFHLEFFRLTENIKGLGKVGDLIGLETNMRTPGGYTPDLIDFANSVDCYQIWADSMAFDENRQKMDYEKFYAAVGARRDNVEYFYRDDEVLKTYKNNICWADRYPEVLSGAMGNRFFMAKFKTLEEVEIFHQYCNRRAGELKIPAMIHDVPKKKKASNTQYETICDTHIDGA